MDRYLETYQEMISLRGLTGHTLKGYSTYIRSYLDYLQHVLHKLPEDISWQEMRDFIHWLQKERALADRIINCAISNSRILDLTQDKVTFSARGEKPGRTRQHGIIRPLISPDAPGTDITP